MQETRPRKLGIDRRNALKLGAGLGAAVATFKLSAPAIAQSKPERIIVNGEGGPLWDVYRKASFNKFTAKTGIEVVTQAYQGAAEFKAAVEGKVWGQGEVYLLSAAEANIVGSQGLAEPIDYGLIDRNDFISEMCGDTWFLTIVVGSVMAWKSDLYQGDAAPKSWTDVFKKTGNFDGQRMLLKDASKTLEIAAMGNGIDKDKLYPLDISAALDALTRIRDDISWWQSGSQATELMASGEGDLGMLYNSRAKILKDEGKVDYTFNQAILEGDGLSIPKGHPNAKWAMELAATMADGANQAAISNDYPIGPAVKSAIPLIAPDRAPNIPTSEKNLPLTKLQDFAWWAEHGSEAFEAFQNWQFS